MGQVGLRSTGLEERQTGYFLVACCRSSRMEPGLGIPVLCEDGGAENDMAMISIALLPELRESGWTAQSRDTRSRRATQVSYRILTPEL